MDELDKALERALAMAQAFVHRPHVEQQLARVLQAAEQLAARGWTVPVRARPAQIKEAAADPDEWMARFYDATATGVLELHLRTELIEWQPLVDQILGAFRRGEYPLVLVGGLATLESVMLRAGPRLLVHGKDLDVTDDDWRTSLRFVVASSIEIAVDRLRPRGDGARHWSVEGRDAPSGWSREDALKVLNALGSASLLLPQRLPRRERPVPTHVSLAPAPALTVVDEPGSVFRTSDEP